MAQLDKLIYKIYDKNEDTEGEDDVTSEHNCTTVREFGHKIMNQFVSRSRYVVNWSPGNSRVDFRLFMDTEYTSQFKSGSFYMDPPPTTENPEEPMDRLLSLLNLEVL